MYKKLIRWGSKFELHDLIMRLNKLWESGCTGKPGVLQSPGSHRVGHDWMTDWTEESGTYLCSPQKAKVKCVWWWQCYLIEGKLVSNACTNGGPPKSCQNLHRTGETGSWRAQREPCVQDPGKRSSDLTKDWPRLAHEGPGVSSGGVGLRWAAAGLGALSV